MKNDAVTELEAQVRDILQHFDHDRGALLAEHLAFRSRLNLYGYSARNVLLIERQNPNVTYVATYGRWKKLGANVLRGQKGLRILVPGTVTSFRPSGTPAGTWKKLKDATPQEKRLVRAGKLESVSKKVFLQGHVFDISQTDFPKEQYPSLYHMGYHSSQHRQLYDALKAYAESRQIIVDACDLQTINLRGDYTPDFKFIRINHLLEDTEKLSTLAHELGHALLHDNAMDLPVSVAECEADAMGICIQSRLGVPLTDSRKRHFCNHLANCRALPDFSLAGLLDSVATRFAAAWSDMETYIDSTPTAAPMQLSAPAPEAWTPDMT